MNNSSIVLSWSNNNSIAEIAPRISNLGKRTRRSPCLHLCRCPNDYHYYFGRFCVSACEGMINLELVLAVLKRDRKQMFCLAPHTLQVQPQNYCREAPSRPASLHLKALIWQNSLGTYSAYPKPHHLQATVTQRWHYGWFASFLEDIQLFYSAGTEETVYKYPNRHKASRVDLGARGDPKQLVSLRHLTLNYSHRTFKDKIFSASGLVMTGTWNSNIQMESISFVSFCHLKMLSLLLESKMLHQKSGRQYQNGGVPTMCSKLTTAFETVRLRI